MVWVGAIDPRVKCIVSVVGIGHGARWMRSVRRLTSGMTSSAAPVKTGVSVPSRGVGLC